MPPFRVLVDNATQLIKEVPDQVNSLVSKHAPIAMEADMKRCNLANKIASENSGFEILHTTQGLVSQHIKGLTDQVGSSVGKFALENPFRTALDVVIQFIKQFLDQVRSLASKILADLDIKELLDQVCALASKILASPLAIIIGSAVTGAILVVGAVAMLGFSTVGVVAGSIAAVIQSLIGNVAAGSLFACLQSAGTAPLMLAMIGAIVGAAVAILKVIGHL